MIPHQGTKQDCLFLVYPTSKKAYMELKVGIKGDSILTLHLL